MLIFVIYCYQKLEYRFAGVDEMLDIRLTTFLAVARIKNYTKAGEILNLTQPAVSQHIKHLEEHFGVSLFRKHGKEITLTEEGEIMYEYAEKLEVIYRNMESVLKNRAGIHRVYHIGASMTIGGYVLPSILAKYKRENENTDILMQVSNTEEIIEKLLTGKIDLALIEGEFDRKKFKYRKFKDDQLVLAVSTAHEFASRDKVSLDEVLAGNLILREKGSGTREIFENKLLEAGYDLCIPKPYMELGSIPAIKSLVEENLGYSIISRETVKRERKLGTIKIVPIEGFEILREFNFLFTDENFQEFIQHFIDFCSMDSEL